MVADLPDDLTRARRCFRDEIAELAREVDATRKDAKFRAALETMAVFWPYSWFNQWFILHQRPTATRVAGRRAWARIGRKVKPDEKPIWILAPTSNGFPFLGVPVFDLKQTRGRRLARLSLTLRGRTRHARALEEAAARLGVEVGVLVGRSDLSGCSYGGRISIRPGLSQRERAAVLAHELAHEILHQQRAARKRPPRLSHSQREAEAEATAFVVLRALGLPTIAPTYIAWQGGDGKMIMSSMRRIQRAARQVLEAAGSSARNATDSARMSQPQGGMEDVALHEVRLL